MRLVIFGGRDFTDINRMSKDLAILYAQSIITNDVILVCGMARGADITGYNIFKNLGLPIETYPADWTKYGRSAGFRRNAEMAAISDVGMGYWDGESKGTKHMIGAMARLNKLTFVHEYQGKYYHENTSNR